MMKGKKVILALVVLLFSLTLTCFALAEDTPSRMVTDWRVTGF